MSQSTPEEQIAVLNEEKAKNIAKINDDISVINQFEQSTITYQTEIADLENINLTYDEIISEITPPPSKQEKK